MRRRCRQPQGRARAAYSKMAAPLLDNERRSDDRPKHPANMIGRSAIARPVRSMRRAKPAYQPRSSATTWAAVAKSSVRSKVIRSMISRDSNGVSVSEIKRANGSDQQHYSGPASSSISARIRRISTGRTDAGGCGNTICSQRSPRAQHGNGRLAVAQTPTRSGRATVSMPFRDAQVCKRGRRSGTLTTFVMSGA